MTSYLIGVDIGGTNVRVGLIDDKLKLIEKRSANLSDFSSAEALLDHIRANIEELSRGQAVNKIGFVLPAPWHEESRVIEDATNIPFLNAYPISKIRSYFADYEIHFENDVNVIAILEAKQGAARASRDSLYVTISTGIGAGIISNGSIVRGTGGYAGEIGHIPIPIWNEEKWELQSLNLEDLCGGKRLEDYALGKLHLSSVAELFELYRQGNPRVKAFMDVWLEYLSVGLAASIQVLSPEILILGGGIITHNRWLLRKIEKKTKEKIFEKIAENLVFKITGFDEDAGLLGAANLCL